MSSILHYKGSETVRWSDGSETVRTLADRVEVSREYVAIGCGSCGDTFASVWVTTYADGWTHQSKCGECYR